VVEPTQVPPTQAPAQATGDTSITLDPALGKGVFTSMTVSSGNLTLRCFPRDVTFNVTTPNNAITDVLFYYRVVDVDRKFAGTIQWKAFGKMTANGNGNFTLTFTGEDVHPEQRLDGGWLDFQFVGLAKSGDVVDRSQTVDSVIRYTFDCP
jgi:hypothetical protein